MAFLEQTHSSASNAAGSRAAGGLDVSTDRTPAARDDGGCDADVIVVGGGLAGLSAAAFAARGGASVLVLERSESVGGRAQTHSEGGFLFNVGPHALYDGGPAASAFAELGVRYSGRRPSATGGLAFHEGRLHALPGGFVSLLTTDLLTLAGKLELGSALGSLGKIDAASLRGQTLRQWLDARFRDPVVRGLVEALMRVTAYANDPGRSCAAASVEQLQAGVGKGVLYLDGGWATLVKGLREAAEAAGATVLSGQRVRSVESADGSVEVVVSTSRAGGSMDDDADAVVRALLPESSREPRVERRYRARTAVLAVPPPVAASLVKGDGSATLARWAADLNPVKAACLDLGLRRLPDPRRLFVVGIDEPLYFSVHSASAKLAPDGAATIHVAKYLGPEPGDAGSEPADEIANGRLADAKSGRRPGTAKPAKAVEAQLEAFCDVVQPGWRNEVVERRYLPSMLVTGALVEAGKARPGPEVDGAPELLVAGDWVGGVSMIADAAVASGRQAGLLAASRIAASRREGTAARA
jgi:phytoene dehydrogenase-like protein